MAKGSFVNYSLHALGLFSLMLIVPGGEATTFSVGGSKGWSVPSDNSPVYNQWAEKMRFKIGDSLWFVYPPANDSVLQVNKEDYTNCTTSSPLQKYTDGHTEFKFNQSGPYYFISGNKGNCLKYEKITVVVLAERTNKSPSPAQSPPSPAPSSTGGSKDTPAPSAESHPPKNAASLVMGFLGSIAAFLGSSLFLAF